MMMRQLLNDEGSGPPSPGLEVWGGVECTLNRVRESYFQQLALNGHVWRSQDIDLFAEIGLRTLRYPFLWEQLWPDFSEKPRWEWARERLERLKANGIHPIAGLLHHGSGPSHTSLLDPDFPDKFAHYARAFAEEFPEVEDYTPINEPLTTARFSALYGFWYPHHQDPKSFARAVLNQSRATVLAMREIRKVQPRARLIQTEDMGRMSGRPSLSYQVDFENERRWLSLDLLCGRWGPDSTMWKYFVEHAKVHPEELAWFSENPCSPDIVGLNHYVTSNRYLDDEIDLYPPHLCGGNGKTRYVDIESVRVGCEEPARLRELLREAWDRYGLALAVTEVHLGCTREEQMRWLLYVWDEATSLRREKIPVVAITAWGLLGHFDWNCFVTQNHGHYESGIFDMRAEEPRATALAPMIAKLSKGERPTHPLLEVKGWWERPCRAIYRKRQDHTAESWDQSQDMLVRGSKSKARRRPLLIAGSSGTLSQAFARICERRGIPYVRIGRPKLDITSNDSVKAILNELDPWGVVNCAGYVNVDRAEHEAEACRRVNVDGCVNLAHAARERKIPLVVFSSDLVFGGEQKTPYIESSQVAPLNVYGQSKADAERLSLEYHGERTLVIRTSAFFGPWDAYNYVTRTLSKLARNELVVAAGDVVVSPTYVPDLVHSTLDLFLDGERGLWHLANRGEVSWAELGQRAALMTGFDPARVQVSTGPNSRGPAQQPRYSALGSERSSIMPSFDNALERYFSEIRKELVEI